MTTLYYLPDQATFLFRFYISIKGNTIDIQVHEIQVTLFLAVSICSRVSGNTPKFKLLLHYLTMYQSLCLDVGLRGEENIMILLVNKLACSPVLSLCSLGVILLSVTIGVHILTPNFYNSPLHFIFHNSIKWILQK